MKSLNTGNSLTVERFKMLLKETPVRSGLDDLQFSDIFLVHFDNGLFFM